MSWSERIPAAIEKGKRRGAEIGDPELFAAYGITVGEVVLAEALWEMWVEYCESLEREEPGDEPPEALQAFTEKIGGSDD